MEKLTAVYVSMGITPPPSPLPLPAQRPKTPLG
jgi:hypothetical protein